MKKAQAIVAGICYYEANIRGINGVSILFGMFADLRDKSIDPVYRLPPESVVCNSSNIYENSRVIGKLFHKWTPVDRRATLK